MPLLGPGGFGGGAWNSPVHLECETTEPWTVEIKLTESNSLDLVGILKALAAAAPGVKAAAPAIVGGRIELVGAAATALAGVLQALFNKTDNLGVANPTWGHDEGDLNPPLVMGGGANVVPKAEVLGHYSYTAEKQVRYISDACAVPAPQIPPPTPPTPTPSPTPPAVPTGPCGSPDHIFFPNVTQATQSWSVLQQTSSETQLVSAEPGVAEPVDTAGIRRGLLDLILSMGQFAANLEISEAAGSPSVPGSVMTSAQAAVSTGDLAKADALATMSTNDASFALMQYKQAFDALVPYLHQGCTAAAVGGFANLLDSPETDASESTAGDETARLVAVAAIASLALLAAGAWYARRTAR